MMNFTVCFRRRLLLCLCALCVPLAAQAGVNDALRTAWLNLVRQFERESQPDPNAASAIALIYVLGLAILPFATETTGKPLPE